MNPKKIKKDCLIIYSGGMDSTVLLHEWKDRIALAITFNYGSKHNAEEYARAELNCRELKIKHYKINLGNIFKHFKSDLLLSGGDIPEGHYEDESMKRTVVPFRNGIMLSIATGIAESYGLKGVLIANHSGDHAIYPDCRKSFALSMSTAMMNGTESKIELYGPYTNITKREIALIGNRLGIKFELTYSCYKGGTIHCGVCGTCTERKEALTGFDLTTYLQ